MSLFFLQYFRMMHNVHDFKKLFPLQYGENNPILRKKSQTVQNINQDIKTLAKALQSLMREYDGVGLAAPQIGHNFRVIAVSQRDTSKKQRELEDDFVMINPTIIGSSKEHTIDEEACLSLPNRKGKVSRPQSITVKFQDIDGKSHIYQAQGYNARIIFHEIDHLDGVLFIDKLV